MENRRNKRSLNRKKQNNVIYLLFIALLVAVLAIILVLALKKRTPVEAANESVQFDDTEADAEKWQEGVISYNGKRYKFNNNIRTYLYMGIDNDDPVKTAPDSVSGGQSDAMFLLVVDEKEEKLSVLAIHRNTMADVDVYDKDGNFQGTYKLQICLAHGYGDGMRTSCSRSVDAVSRLLYNLPINGYLALNMGGIPMLNDAVGGVTVEVLNDLDNPSRGVSLKEGETVTLNGDEAYVYLRSRDTKEYDSASVRLKRQIQYIENFMEKGKNLSIGSATQAYNATSDYIVTNIDFASLAEEVLSCEFDSSRMYEVPGEVTMGETYEEYYVDEEALYEMIIEIFYVPVE